MTEQERLYDHLGELLYAIAMADGIIQTEEKEKLHDLVKDHPWGETVKWSFDYSAEKNLDVESVYNKVIHFCHGYGPTPVYEEFISAMKSIAEAANGVDESEEKLMHSFSHDLIARFKRDLELKFKQS